jgi:hypothetical protein
MRKGFMGIISLALIFCLVLAGCGSAQAKDSGSEEAAQSEQDTPEVVSEQDTPEVTQQGVDQQAAEGEETMTTGEQTTPEVVQTGQRSFRQEHIQHRKSGCRTAMTGFTESRMCQQQKMAKKCRW